jgi:hypothetical protein
MPPEVVAFESCSCFFSVSFGARLVHDQLVMSRCYSCTEQLMSRRFLQVVGGSIASTPHGCPDASPAAKGLASMPIVFRVLLFPNLSALVTDNTRR